MDELLELPFTRTPNTKQPIYECEECFEKRTCDDCGIKLTIDNASDEDGDLFEDQCYECFITEFRKGQVGYESDEEESDEE